MWKKIYDAIDVMFTRYSGLLLIILGYMVGTKMWIFTEGDVKSGLVMLSFGVVYEIVAKREFEKIDDLFDETYYED